MTVTDGSNTLLLQLATWALRVIAVAGAAAFALAAFRVKSISVRLTTWTAVLYAAIAMPLLGWLLPPLPVPLPTALQPAAHASSMDVSRSPAVARPETVTNAAVPRVAKRTRLAAAAGKLPSESFDAPSKSLSFASFPRAIRWDALAGAIYLTAASFLLLRLGAGLVLAHRLIRSSRSIVDERLTSRMRSCASALSFIPRAAESELISVPVTMGLLRPIIALPADWREWDDAKLDAVISHEASHVARRDALTQCVALIHRAIFWFSPLAWWLNRHLANLAEQASDEAALSSGADRNDYARTLLGFFEALQAAPGRVWWQGVSMAKAGQAAQRVERILAWKKAGGAVTMSLKKSASVAIIALAVPAVYLAASVRPSSGSPAAPPAPQSQEYAPPPAPAVAPVAPVATASSKLPPAAVASVAPPAPVAAVAPVFPPPAWSGQSHGSGRSHGGSSYAYGYDDEQRFVIVTGKSDSLTMSGTSEDARHVEKLRKQITGDFIWFQRDEKSYIIRDQATVDHARKLWAPQEELGKKQEELGKKQEELGKQQEELGSKMEQVRVNVPDMTAALDKLKAKLQKLGSSATMEQIGDLQSEIGELQSKMGEIQSQAGDQQGKLGELQGALGEKQGKLGEEQGELGRQQAELAQKASIQMKELLDEAIKKGTAQPEPETGGGAASL